tara:strand:+ start:8737 stop:8967 length:231 start_codon:yes stop_codon:yes gene_type:complete
MPEKLKEREYEEARSSFGIPLSAYKSPNDRPGAVHMSIEDTYKHTIAELEKEKHYYMDKYVAAQKELDELKKIQNN